MSRVTTSILAADMNLSSLTEGVAWVEAHALEICLVAVLVLVVSQLGRGLVAGLRDES